MEFKFLILILCNLQLLFSVSYKGSNSVAPKSSLMLILSSLLIFIYGLVLVGFRVFDPLEGDTDAYLYVFANINDVFGAWDVGTHLLRMDEYLFWPFQAVLKIFSNERMWLVLNYAIGFLLVVFAHSVYSSRGSSKRYWLTGVLVYMSYYVVFAGNAMRQELAAPVALLATVLWWYGNRKWALVAFLVSVGFHWSSLLYGIVPILFIFSKKYLKITLVSLGALFFLGLVGVGFGAIFDVLGIDAVSNKYELYSTVGSVSHFGSVFDTKNFWLILFVSCIYMLFLYFDKIAFDEVSLFFLVTVIPVYAFVSMADVSERYFYNVFLVFPVLVLKIFDSLFHDDRLPLIGLSVVMSIFSIATFFNDSARIVLGY